MSTAAASKKAAPRAAKRKTTPSKDAPKAKKGDGSRVSHFHQIQTYIVQIR